ncbi:MAG TPA: hypothetical protein PK348_01635 [Spirochaetota bacterium]|nr:hypothetical protein [Spirochaetota bacterium]
MYILRENFYKLLTNLIITIFFIFACDEPSHGHGKNELWYYPDCYTIQTAGYIGFIAMGIGFLSFNNTWESSLLYGFSPADVTGKEIHTVSWKNIVYPFTLNFLDDNVLLPFYFGVTMLFVMDKNVYWERSTNCPDRYYNPTGRHSAVSVGLQIQGKSTMIGLIHGFYVEITILDTYLKACLWDDSEYLNFDDVASLAIGYKIITKY